MAGETIYGIPIDTPQWGLADPQPAQQVVVQSRDLPPSPEVVMQPVQRDIARSNNNYNPTGTYQYGQQTGIMPPINHAQPFTNLTHMVSPYTGQVFNLTGYPSKYPHMIFGDLFDTTAPYVNAIIPWLQMGMQMAASGQQAAAPASTKESSTTSKTTDTTKKTEPERPPFAVSHKPYVPMMPAHKPYVPMAPSHTPVTTQDVLKFSGPTSTSHHNGTQFLITPPVSSTTVVNPSTTGLLDAAGVAPAPSIDPSTTGLLEAAGIAITPQAQVPMASSRQPVSVPASSTTGLLEAAGVAPSPTQPVPMASSRQPVTTATTRRTTAPTASNSRTQGPQSLVEAARISNTTPEGVYLLGNGQGMTRDGNVVIVQQDSLTGQYRYFDLNGNPIAIF